MLSPRGNSALSVAAVLAAFGGGLVLPRMTIVGAAFIAAGWLVLGVTVWRIRSARSGDTRSGDMFGDPSARRPGGAP